MVLLLLGIFMYMMVVFPIYTQYTIIVGQIHYDYPMQSTTTPGRARFDAATKADLPTSKFDTLNPKFDRLVLFSFPAVSPGGIGCGSNYCGGQSFGIQKNRTKKTI